jgi:hypothetical protein
MNLRNTMARFARLCFAAAFAGTLLLAGNAVTASSADAALIRYKLTNHPDGRARPPLYGLRLDGLYNPSDPTAAFNGVDYGVFTFDFDAPSASMLLDYDDIAGTIRIHGSAFGGLDIGNAYDSTHSGVVEIDFTYTSNVFEDGSPNVLEVSPEDPNNNTGTFEFVSGFSGAGGLLGTAVSLFDEQGSHGFSFKFNNLDNHRLTPNGHTPPFGIGDTFEGWGWMNHHEPNVHISASDWLFVGNRVSVPEPATLSIFGLGLAGLGYMRRKRAV